MPVELGKLIDELGMRMRLLRVAQEGGSESENLSERDVLLLELLNGRGRMTVSEVAAAHPNVSESTISTNITKLWRNQKLVSKTINPDNQRVTFVELADKGRQVLRVVKQQRSERLATLFRAMEFADGEREVLQRLAARAITFFDEYLGMKKNPIENGKQNEGKNQRGVGNIDNERERCAPVEKDLGCSPKGFA
jgi:DNA-binding MarR family transcriptional regulator